MPSLQTGLYWITDVNWCVVWQAWFVYTLFISAFLGLVSLSVENISSSHWERSLPRDFWRSMCWGQQWVHTGSELRLLKAKGVTPRPTTHLPFPIRRADPMLASLPACVSRWQTHKANWNSGSACLAKPHNVNEKYMFVLQPWKRSGVAFNASFSQQNRNSYHLYQHIQWPGNGGSVNWLKICSYSLSCSECTNLENVIKAKFSISS